MKKIISIIVSAFICASVFAVDLNLRLLPEFDFTFNKVMNQETGMKENIYKNGFNGLVSFDVVPITVRERDSIYFSAQASATNVNINGKDVKFDSINFLNAGIATGYNFRFMDRMSAFGEASFGFWNLLDVPSQMKVEGKEYDLPSGLYYGGKVGLNYFFLPEFSAFGYLGFKNYVTKTPMYTSLSIGVGITYNFTKGLLAKTAVETTGYNTQALFPVFYSHYNDNSFGNVSFVNNEPNQITDVEVQLLIEQYMTNPKTIAVYENIGSGEEFTADLTAFLSENILESMLNRTVDAQLIVNYKSLGKKLTYKESVEIQALNRNSMSWEDDRRAAAFVSGRDAAALQFAKQVVSIVKKNFSDNKPVNVQYAAALFGALKAYGISYVIDPASAFTDNVGSAAIDFLQFPYQTLLYHGGDCDDLTILNCSLLEAIGVPTAFITVPGHIYMAFDSGVSLEEADEKLGKGKYIVKNNIAWVPVEITVSQDTFGLALSIGLREWKKYESEAVLIPLSEAWKEYKPVSIPESDIPLEMPKKDKILKEFKEAIK